MTSFCRIFMFSRGKRKEKGMTSSPALMFLVGSLQEIKITHLYHQSKSTHTHTCDCETRQAGTNTKYWFKKMEQYLASEAFTLFLIQHTNVQLISE